MGAPRRGNEIVRMQREKGDHGGRPYKILFGARITRRLLPEKAPGRCRFARSDTADAKRRNEKILNKFVT
jgi:hypothetical protein